MNIELFLSEIISEQVNHLFELNTQASDIIIQKTKKEFEGDYTLVTFPFVKASKLSPEQTGETIGNAIVKANANIIKFNIVKGFLNISLSNEFWLNAIATISATTNYGIKASKSSGKQLMLEYSSPNTNKPLHLGHIRNNLLGFSVAEILKTQGHDVIKVNIINDRGIHICKSMLAWQLFGNGETPQSSGLKGDHLVGKYYVEFEKRNQIQAFNLLCEKINNPFEIKDGIKWYVDLNEHPETSLIILIKRAEDIINTGYDDALNFKQITKAIIALETDEKKRDYQKEIFENYFLFKTPLMISAREMLLKWEAGDAEVINLWKTMNGWVYEGFDVTYKKLGVDFDKLYYESNTYILGKEIVQQGLENNIFYKKENGSTCIDLTNDGLDEKVVLRSDGTSVYITQDLGTAIERFKEFPNLSQLIYTVGNEQDYHFKVLFKILEKLGYSWAKECYHLSYGMVELPDGKMKSREGTVVDADELIDSMIATAKQTTEELGKVEGFTAEELNTLYHTIGMGALKYFLLKVEPAKKMLFNPKESIDFNGHTGTFIQYSHARIKSILRKIDSNVSSITIDKTIDLHDKEKDLIKYIHDFNKVLIEAANTYNPAVVANYIYDLTKTFNQFYNECPVVKEENLLVKDLRVKLVETTANIIKNGMRCLGIDVPERM